ncbi:MAG TPA: molecular chaperone DnaJ [Sphingobium sp.]|uniref:molecular chaperone DnaJ n=1 Tax=Sphingobium sp. TaxID=1912891 RepID=UPI002ED3A054
MGLLGVLLGGWLVWLLFTGRIGRPSSGQIAALVLALVGGAIAARGRPIIGGGMAIAGLIGLSRKPARVRPARAPGPAPQEDAGMREALDLLGLPRDADRAAVTEAHRRLIARTHPDTGGTEALARAINAARDYLLERLPR